MTSSIQNLTKHAGAFEEVSLAAYSPGLITGAFFMQTCSHKVSDRRLLVNPDGIFERANLSIAYRKRSLASSNSASNVSPVTTGDLDDGYARSCFDLATSLFFVLFPAPKAQA